MLLRRDSALLRSRGSRGSGLKATQAVRLLAGRLTSKSLSPPGRSNPSGPSKPPRAGIHSVLRMERSQWMERWAARWSTYGRLTLLLTWVLKERKLVTLCRLNDDWGLLMGAARCRRI